jgi:hypothetical protein
MKQLGRNEAKFDYKETAVDETDIEDLDKEEIKIREKAIKRSREYRNQEKSLISIVKLGAFQQFLGDVF